MAHKKNYKSVGYLYYEIDNVVLNPDCMMGKLSVVENNLGRHVDAMLFKYAYVALAGWLSWLKH